jgi:zinc protease
VIGWMDDLQHLHNADLRAWYRKWYAPNNATLVVAGDVEAERVLKLAKKHFGPLKPSDLGELKPRKEIAPLGMRRITVKRPAEVPYLIMGYRVPVLRTAEQEWEAYALEVLAGVLDGGNSARLSREVVRGSQIAVSAGAGYGLYSRIDDQFLLDGSPAQGKTIEQVEAALRAQIQRLHDEPVSQAELERIKAQVVAGKVYELDSVFYQAMQIGTLETVGLDWRKLDEYVERIKAVTPQQLQQVARKYLVDDRLTVAVLEPLPINGKAKARSGGSHVAH